MLKKIDSPTRRSTLKTLALSGLGSFFPVDGLSQSAAVDASLPAVTGAKLKPWALGTLDIHHISTGRGNATFVVGPDGTTMLIDAGALHAAPDWSSDEKFRIQARPDSSRRPGQWIAQYISRHMPTGRAPEIDFFILTHLHPDHMGGLDLMTKKKNESRFGAYELTGVMDVHEEVPIKKIVDRGYPNYNYPVPLNDPHQLNYRKFISSFSSHGGAVERFVPGVSKQISLLHSDHGTYPTFSVQNLAVNGRVWTGKGNEVVDTFPDLMTLSERDYPTENKCSLALTVTYGGFRYFSAGDMDHDTDYGRLVWGDIETRVAAAAGPVDVAMANHHGYVNACGPDWARHLRPRAVVISAWDSAHPTITSLGNMLSTDLYPGPRDIYSTALKAENIIATKQLRDIQSGDGNVVIRVPKTQDRFEVFVTTNRDETDGISTNFGPYPVQR
jgi:beta-lactamase superfamily II metal-dependent hydrolase